MSSTSRPRQRKSPTPPDTRELARQVGKLKIARRGGNLEWPAGIRPGNPILDRVTRGVPEPLANRGKPHNIDEDEFVSCAAASHWPHAKTAAYLGRSPQSVRLTLFRLGKAQDAAERVAERTAEESTEVPAQGPEYFAQFSASFIASRRMPRPSSTPRSAGFSWFAVQQPNGLVLFESEGQTTLERQTVDARTDPVCLGSSDLLQRDRSGMNALAEAAAIVMGTAQGQAA